MAAQVEKHQDECERPQHAQTDNTGGVKTPWQTGKSAKECHRYKFEQQLHCDVWFTVNKPEPTKIGAHKYMLMTRSPVFEAMFSDVNQSPSHVTIDEFKVQIFNQLLKYIYTDEVDLQADNVLNMFSAAKRYGLDEVVTRTKNYLVEVLDIKNIWRFLNQSAQLENCDMKNVCIDFIANNILRLLKTEEFLTLSQDLLLAILERDELFVELETNVYFACISWAKNKVPEDPTDNELRQILGPCLYHIRFAAMTLDKFGETGGKSGLLSDNEKLAFFCYISNHEKQNELEKAGFSTIPRYLENDCNLFDPGNVSVPMYTNKIKQNELKLSVDKEINIHGINVLSCGKSGSYDIIVKFNYDTVKKGEMTTQNTNPYLLIQLDKPVNLRPGSSCTITVTPEPYYNRCPNTPKYTATQPRSTVQAQNVLFTIEKNENNFITSIVFNRV